MNMKQLIAGTLLGAGVLLSAASLEDSFRNPPQEAKPKTWWHWMDNFISKEGITKDLEAMSRIGLGGATILDIEGGFGCKGNVKVLSPQWFEMVNHTVKEADRLGLVLTVHNCPGWSSSGGPWIRPQYAMKKLYHKMTVVEGGKKIDMILPMEQPPKNYYQDVAVLAYPSMPGDGFELEKSGVKLSSDINPKMKLPRKPEKYFKYLTDPNELLNNKIWYKQLILWPKAAKKPQYITFAFDKPFTAASARLFVSGPPWGNISAHMELWISDDGMNFRKHYTSPGWIDKNCYFSFPVVTAKYFRVTVPDVANNSWMPITKVELSPTMRIPDYEKKAFFTQDHFRVEYYWRHVLNAPKEQTIKLDSIIDLTDKMDKTGRLLWDAPKGKWTILRFTCATFPSGNHPANPEGRGLECDKLAASGVDEVWRGMMGKIVSNAGPLAGKSLGYTLIDSYEVGCQNWTERMPSEFKELRSYDMRKYLPILAGRYVESTEISERFLADFRRTVSDLYAKYYGKYFADLAHKNNIQFVTEPYGTVFDGLLQGECADVPMGEFWRGFNSTGNARFASNIADVNGLKFVQTETFTAGQKNAAWTSYPEVHKIQGDAAYCAGVNRFVFHSYAHQPWEVDTPGMTMGQWGFHFNRKNTMWNFYPGWIKYLTRAQHLLQQGHSRVDVLYVAPENTPSSYWAGTKHIGDGLYSNNNKIATLPWLPYGYVGNCCSTRALREKLRFKGNGQVGFDHGMTYYLLVFNQVDENGVKPESLQKIADLAEQGAHVLLCEKPEKAFGLTNYPASDKKIKELVEKLWGGLDGRNLREKPFGKGRIYYGMMPAEILAKRGIGPDFATPGIAENADIRFIHRTLPEYEIYFVANSSKDKVTFKFPAQFRVKGMTPEFWDAETGRISNVPAWQQKGNVIEIPLSMDYSNSKFIVFRKKAAFSSLKSESKQLSNIHWKGSVKAEKPLIIKKALWQAKDKSKGKDVTALINKKLGNGSSVRLSANSQDLGGDSAPNKSKELYVEYILDGKPGKISIDEWKGKVLETKKTAAVPDGGRYELIADKNGMFLYASCNGVLTYKDGSGKPCKIDVGNVAKPKDLSTDWNIKFQKGRGAPDEIFMKELTPLNEQKEFGVKYFSGESTYTRSFELAEADFKDSRIMIDLGAVYDVCKVKINGKDLGFIWHAPYRFDITPAAKIGRNTIEVCVANRWINRLIGDEQLPPDCELRGDFLKTLPDWFKQGKKSPTGRIAFTTYHIWKKNDKLEKAGLAGPVKLEIEKKIKLY